MQLWTYDRYRAPRLSVDEIEPDESEAAVILHADGASYRLGLDDPKAIDAVAAQLSSLRESEAPLWATVRESPPGSAWHDLATFLDKRSLIAEGADASEQALRRLAARTEALVVDTGEAILRDLSESARGAMTARARRLLDGLREAGAAGRPFTFGTDPYDARRFPDFFEALVGIELDYLAIASPPTLNAVAALLARLAGADPGPALHDADVYDLHDLESHLWLVATSLVRAGNVDAARFEAAPVPPAGLCSGMEFMRRIELLTRSTLGIWGTNPYVAALDRVSGENAPLIAGPYIEQYHVTRRFVEIVTPLLSRRLKRPLRALFYQYYSEEVGHEELESATCESLGVTPAALDRAIPLPLHFAFVDVLTQVARTDPIASFASVMVIEGVFGEPPRMSLRLEAVGAMNPEAAAAADEHESLNEDLNHNSIARDAFCEVEAVAPDRQASAIRKILFLLELNHRAWGGIADFYGPQAELILHGSLGAPLDPRFAA